ncbi:MAG: aspartyl/asparaginyl beta-hydroxylase domain-containing protein [Acidobacteriaceae bacterium]|nr:aspartyl/asparaginyl beta-hydroxylase domain-containing protein [Acidobacteriaceae bacterium]
MYPRWQKLPLFFPPDALIREVQAIPEEQWVPHFNTQDYEGHWSSLALCSASGRTEDIFPSSSNTSFYNTPLYAEMPALRAVLEHFRFPLKSVRLLRLQSESTVREHRDRDLSLRDGELRLHVPIMTNEQVEFIVANRQLPLRAGEAWFIDFSQPHRIYNRSSSPRVHLVIDGSLNEWAKELLERAQREVVTETFPARGIIEFERFCATAWQDQALMDRLRGITAPQALLEAVTREGQLRGFHFVQEDAASILRENREAWNLRTMNL